MSDELPEALVEIRDAFLEVDRGDRLALLAEIADELPPLPPRYVERPELTERVAECQSPVFIVVEVEADRVAMHATAPAEAPTTRGFASILVQGLTGTSVDQALAVPADLPRSFGLDDLVSPLRLSGMSGMIMRAQRQIRARRG